jgi:hypothetical protein
MLALTRKTICPFFSLIFMMGCGKKMTEPESVSKPHIENQVPSPTLILAIEQRLSKFVSTHNGQYILPRELRVRSNNALGKVVTIIYNIRADEPDTYDAKCIYKGIAEDTMPVDRCVDQDGIDLGDITDGQTQMIIPAGNSIELESNSDELKADAIYDVNWI